MPSPFDPITIAGVEIRNRFMRSATWDASATDDGDVTDASVAIFEKLAQGSVGLIVTGYSYISDVGKAAAGQYGISDDRHIEGLRRLAEAAHGGGARIAAQIAHTGGNVLLLRDRQHMALAPSQLESNPAPHRAFTSAEIEDTIADFAAAAVRARKAGFDAVQLHFAHGYLGNQFISPLTNHRDDEWGGSPERRRRFLLEVVRAVRKATGGDFPVWAKFGLVEGEGGMSLEEGLDALKAMAAEGLCAVEISAGEGAAAVRTERPEDEESPFFAEESRAAKRAVDIPVAVVGGIRSLATAEGIVANGGADLISMSRPFIREPNLVARWQSGDTAPVKCIRDNKCMAAIYTRRVFECQEEALLRQSAAAESR